MFMDRTISYARMLIKGREGYALKPSQINPRVKRWMKLAQGNPKTLQGRAAFDAEAYQRAFKAYLSDPKAFRRMPPMLTKALMNGERHPLPYSQTAQLARLQTAIWEQSGGVQELLDLIGRRKTAAGQFGPEHLALMEELARAGRPLITDVYDAFGGEFEEWASAIEEGVSRMGGQVLGSIPRTSAFRWDWSWGPPDNRQIRREVEGETVLINPEGVLLIAPPEGREADFAQEYFERVTKEAPRKKRKEADIGHWLKVADQVVPLLRQGKEPDPNTHAGRRHIRATGALLENQNRENQAHREAYEQGRKLAPLGWYEPDTRTNYDVTSAWAEGRLSTTENGIHYVSYDTSKPGPKIRVDPFISQWIEYSQVPDDDVYISGARRYAATMGGMSKEMIPPVTQTLYYAHTNREIATKALVARDPDYVDFMLERSANPDLPLEPGQIDPWDEGPHGDAFEVPFRLPDPNAGGGWVAFFSSQIIILPDSGGPWVNMAGSDITAPQILWINGNGKLGYSRLKSLKNPPTLEQLRAQIQPIDEIEGFRMPPEDKLNQILEINAKSGWTMERLMALARGEIEVENPALGLFS
jgi:hypothetical protein